MICTKRGTVYSRTVLYTLTTIGILLSGSSWAQTFSEAGKQDSKYTFLDNADSVSIKYPSSIYTPGYFFISNSNLQDTASAYGFNDYFLNQAYYDIHFEKFTLHSVLPPVINELGDVSAFNVVGHDSISVVAHQMDHLQHISVQTIEPMRYKYYLLFSTLPWILPSMLYLDEPEDLFLTSSLFATIYAPVAVASLGFHDSGASLLYKGKTYFDVPGEFQVSPALSTSYVMNQLFRYYRYEDSFRLLPIVGLNTSIIHHLSPTQLSLGIYYALGETLEEYDEEHSHDHLDTKNRLMINAGMNYPLLFTDKLYVDFETGVSATFNELASPYLRINWSPQIGSLKRFTFTHHLLMGSGFDLNSGGTISGWPLLHFVNFSLIPPTRYSLRSKVNAEWLVGAGTRNVRSTYWYDDHQSEYLPSLSLSRNIENRTYVTFEGGIGPESTVEGIDYDYSWSRRSSTTTSQLFFTSMRLERIFPSPSLDFLFGGGVIYVLEFREQEQVEYDYDRWQETTRYHDEDSSELGFLLTFSVSKEITPKLSLVVGLDMDGFRMLDEVFDEFESLDEAVSARAGIKYNVSKWLEGR